MCDTLPGFCFTSMTDPPPSSGTGIGRLADVRWYALEPADSSFFSTAPVRLDFSAHFAAPPLRVWESLTSDQSVAAWGRAVQSVRWTSPRPLGVGSTREVVLALNTATVREEFFRWDEGRGYSFCARESNRPGLRRFAEDYEVSAAGTGTLFTWQVALEPVPAATAATRLLAPALRVVLGQLVRDGVRYFAHP